MTASDLERRFERLSAGHGERPVDVDAAWRRFTQSRGQAARRRHAAVTVLAVVAVLAAAVVTGSVVARHQAKGEPSGGSHGKKSAGGGRIRITARIPQPGSAMAWTVVGQRGQVWGMTYHGYLFRIDPQVNRVAFRERIAGLTDIAAGGGSIWVVTAHGGSSLLRIDPLTGSVIRTLAVPRGCDQVLYGGTQLWLACGRPAIDFIRLDPATGRTLAETGKINGVTNVVASPDGIWYSGNSGLAGFIGTGRRLRWVHVDDAAYPVSMTLTDSLVYGMGALWAFTSDESVAKIDIATGRIVRIYTYQTYDPSYSNGLGFAAVGLGSLWFTDYDSQRSGVLRVSPATGLVQARVSGIGLCYAPCWQIDLAAGSIWVPTKTYIARIDPVRPSRRH